MLAIPLNPKAWLNALVLRNLKYEKNGYSQKALV